MVDNTKGINDVTPGLTMSSNDSTSVASSASPPGDGRRVIGGRATEDQIFLIDRAVLQRKRRDPKLSRADFIVASAVERAKQELESAGAAA